jgi:hypothetical protein
MKIVAEISISDGEKSRKTLLDSWVYGVSTRADPQMEQDSGAARICPIHSIHLQAHVIFVLYHVGTTSKLKNMSTVLSRLPEIGQQR